MASEPITSPVTATAPFQAWLTRLGVSGKILTAGSVVGIIAVFLPLLRVAVNFPAAGSFPGVAGKTSVNIPGLGVSHSVQVIQDWRGVVCLVGYVAAVGLSFVLYSPNGLRQNSFAWAAAIAGGVITLLALWLVVSALNSGSTILGATLKVSVGVGAILNLLAAGTVTAGGILKAREEKLF